MPRATESEIGMTATITFYEVRPDAAFGYLDIDGERDEGWRWLIPGHRDGLEVDGRAWGDTWRPPPVHFTDTEPGDFAGIAYISCGAFAVRLEALQEHGDLEVFLGLAGELLPLPCDGREFKLVNVTEVVDALDWQSSINRETGEPGVPSPQASEIQDPRFHVDRLDGQLFKIPESAGSEIFYWERSTGRPGEQFRRYCEQRRLTGLEFRPIYSTTIAA
jgi:hypothetical protein